MRGGGGRKAGGKEERTDDEDGGDKATGLRQQAGESQPEPHRTGIRPVPHQHLTGATQVTRRSPYLTQCSSIQPKSKPSDWAVEVGGWRVGVWGKRCLNLFLARSPHTSGEKFHSRVFHLPDVSADVSWFHGECSTFERFYSVPAMALGELFPIRRSPVVW